jgi:uncharacterized protein
MSAMTRHVLVTDDAAEALEQARTFLEREPVLHNLVLTLLTTRVRRPEPGRYWLALCDGEVVGVAFQSPLEFVVTITPMDAATVDRVVETMAAAGVRPPGVSGEAGSVARFAGSWTEHATSGARPRRGERIYEITDVSPPSVAGSVQRAGDRDREMLTRWLEDFHVDAGETPVQDPARTVADRVAAGQFWLWERDGPVAAAALTAPVAGVSRVQAVYTPPANRRQGYASALVASLSTITLDAGHRCVLYTDLANSTSNSIYRAIGYRAVAEVLRYDFD